MIAQASPSHPLTWNRADDIAEDDRDRSPVIDALERCSAAALIRTSVSPSKVCPTTICPATEHFLGNLIDVTLNAQKY
jgi:hypothetical protein